MTQQQSLDYAVDELKRQAAKVGANTIVLGSRSTGTQYVENFPSEKEIVQGVAVFVGK